MNPIALLSFAILATQSYAQSFLSTRDTSDICFATPLNLESCSDITALFYTALVAAPDGMLCPLVQTSDLTLAYLKACSATYPDDGTIFYFFPMIVTMVDSCSSTIGTATECPSGQEPASDAYPVPILQDQHDNCPIEDSLSLASCAAKCYDGYRVFLSHSCQDVLNENSNLGDPICSFITCTQCSQDYLVVRQLLTGDIGAVLECLSPSELSESSESSESFESSEFSVSSESSNSAESSASSDFSESAESSASSDSSLSSGSESLSSELASTDSSESETSESQSTDVSSESASTESSDFDSEVSKSTFAESSSATLPESSDDSLVDSESSASATTSDVAATSSSANFEDLIDKIVAAVYDSTIVADRVPMREILFGMETEVLKNIGAAGEDALNFVLENLANPSLSSEDFISVFSAFTSAITAWFDKPLYPGFLWLVSQIRRYGIPTTAEANVRAVMVKPVEQFTTVIDAFSAKSAEAWAAGEAFLSVYDKLVSEIIYWLYEGSVISSLDKSESYFGLTFSESESETALNSASATSEFASETETHSSSAIFESVSETESNSGSTISESGSKTEYHSGSGAPESGSETEPHSGVTTSESVSETVSYSVSAISESESLTASHSGLATSESWSEAASHSGSAASESATSSGSGVSSGANFTISSTTSGTHSTVSSTSSGALSTTTTTESCSECKTTTTTKTSYTTVTSTSGTVVVTVTEPCETTETLVISPLPSSGFTTITVTELCIECLTSTVVHPTSTVKTTVVGGTTVTVTEPCKITETVVISPLRSGYVTATEVCQECKTSTTVYATGTTKTTVVGGATVTVTEPCETTEVFVISTLPSTRYATVTTPCTSCITSAVVETVVIPSKSTAAVVVSPIPAGSTTVSAGSASPTGPSKKSQSAPAVVHLTSNLAQVNSAAFVKAQSLYVFAASMFCLFFAV